MKNAEFKLQMFKITTNQTIALAGLYQSLALLQQVAWQGESTHSCLAPTLESILKVDIDNFVDAYGSISNLYLGLNALKETLEKRHDQRVIERTRYAINLMYLENKLQTNSRTMSSLASQIERINTLYTFDDDESLSEIARDLGELYRDYISPLGPKIIVEGSPTYLKMEQHANMIRALLLAGLRAIVLWRQAQGKRWTLLFGRNSILKNITALEQGI